MSLNVPFLFGEDSLLLIDDVAEEKKLSPPVGPAGDVSSSSQPKKDEGSNAHPMIR